ncbi:uncharacterized protein LOC108914503 [Anoplophora glabripennis]|uniref:uncharacterized protein LOC108914503 n=1 Tax=Anoplophora glabripennis TaxID=217634 RepID=UPI000C77857B|nr:uncharacterized protein LOC108914503 [Anoplophora glabripennis]
MSSSSSSAETPSPKRFKTDLEPDQEVIIYDDNKEDIDFLKGETSSTSTASETQDEIIKMLPGVDTETTADTATGPQTSCRGILSVVVPKVQPSKKDTVLKQKKKIKILQQSVRRHWTWVRTLHSLIEVLKKKAMITDNAETTLMIEWDGKTFFGYVDVGTNVHSDSLPEARGTDGLNAEEKAALVMNGLEFINSSGVEVTSLTFDGAPTNFIMACQLGANFRDTSTLTKFFYIQLLKTKFLYFPILAI